VEAAIFLGVRSKSLRSGPSSMPPRSSFASRFASSWTSTSLRARLNGGHKRAPAHTPPPSNRSQAACSGARLVDRGRTSAASNPACRGPRGFLGRPKYSTAIHLTTVILRSYNAAPPWNGEGSSSTRCSTAQSAPVFKGIVLLDKPGLRIVRDVLIINHHSNHHSPERHCEIDFDVPVPAADLLWNEGDSFAGVQSRLGSGATASANWRLN
jgi:hypothetical protein